MQSLRESVAQLLHCQQPEGGRDRERTMVGTARQRGSWKSPTPPPPEGWGVLGESYFPFRSSKERDLPQSVICTKSRYSAVLWFVRAQPVQEPAQPFHVPNSQHTR